MSPTTPKPATPSFVRRGLTLVEIILGLVVGALLVFAAFVSYQQVFTKTREQAELAALKSVAREAQALLAISGADRWDTQAGLDAVIGALEDWPATQAAGVAGVFADDSDLVVTEADAWPGMSELTFTRAPNTLLMVVALDDGACVVTAPPHTGTIQGGCVSNLDAIGESSPSEAVTNQQIPGINNTTAQPEQPAPTTTTEPTTTTTAPPTTTTIEPEPDPGFWAQITAGSNHSCGITTGGDAYCWGNNTYGQMGNGNTPSQTTPVKVVGNHSFVSITAGVGHSCGVTTGGDAYCWGQNNYGQLGNGNISTYVGVFSPAKVSGKHTFVSITAGNNHTCGVTTGGDAYCWGYNYYSQVGTWTAGVEQSAPIKVPGNHSFMSITAGGNHTCGVTTDGDTYCWGNNTYGQVGNGNTNQETAPGKVIGNHSFVSITAGGNHT
ncbi:MAG: hypothetical protein WC184_12240, partial [Acidimicrobiia bacterium]